VALRLDGAELALQRFAADGTARRLFQDTSSQPRWVLGAAWRF
jgi:hypothetical protein